MAKVVKVRVPDEMSLEDIQETLSRDTASARKMAKHFEGLADRLDPIKPLIEEIRSQNEVRRKEQEDLVQSIRAELETVNKEYRDSVSKLAKRDDATKADLESWKQAIENRLDLLSEELKAVEAPSSSGAAPKIAGFPVQRDEDGFMTYIGIDWQVH